MNKERDGMATFLFNTCVLGIAVYCFSWWKCLKHITVALIFTRTH